MILITRGVTDGYEIESLSRMLFPKIKVSDKIPTKNFVLAEIKDNGEFATLNVLIDVESEERVISRRVDSSKQLSRLLALLMLQCFYDLTGKKPQWGILTGIRPIKFYRNLLSKGFDDDGVIKEMKQRWGVGEQISDFALSIAKKQVKAMKGLRENAVSIYVGIAFCPSRCSYCTFVSQSVKKDRKLIPKYLDTLLTELKEISKTVKKYNKFVDTIYIGGGTPTVLTASQLKLLTDNISELFPMESVLEYTVEGGRPDTITQEKLTVLKNAGVGRISVNPQTMIQSVLDAVGREHTVEDIYKCYKMAKSFGFLINMDLIAGLPSDTFEGFCYSLDSLIKLDPDNITVHSLTLKRGSDISLGNSDSLYKNDGLISKMVDYSREKLKIAGYNPYYLYRQKGTLGNLDNTGYEKNNTPCLYNIVMMEEVESVIAAGAGSVTRLCRGKEIKRVFNMKLPLEYVKNPDRIYENQSKAGEFFEKGNTNS